MSAPAAAAEAAPVAEVQALSSKQIKKIAKPEFAAKPEKFYPVETLKKWGFSRAQCPTCGEHYWRHTDKKTNCGDSRCAGLYSFIGKGMGKGTRGQHITYAQAWEGFRKSLTSSRIPATAIKRYPVVARWRTDVDYVAAGIYCFQPFCVTGELEPPANPLICPQFCLRFNDLDNIGLSGRHFSGFVMLGIQVFNKPGKYVFFKDECVEFNLRWLTEELEIPLDEITLVEDVWCGGGNLGPSIEYFIGGLELGNMVFMQYRVTNPCTGAYEPLKVQVIDVGIGLERIPWLINGAPTSYVTTFPKALEFLGGRLHTSYMNPIVEKFGPYSCLLNMDEIDDINATWDQIARLSGVGSKEALLAGIAEARDMYIVCDHTRSVLMAVEDGSLPSSVGGAANLRNVLRRVFMVLHKNGWFDKLGGIKGLLELFAVHRTELAELYGPFPEYRSFPEIIEIEYQRWATTDEKVKSTLATLIKKKKGKKLEVADWLYISKNYGITADAISQALGEPIPDNYYNLWAEMNEQKVRPPPEQLYDMADATPTHELFYEPDTQELYEFDATIAHVFEKVESMAKKSGELRVVALNQTCFYPCAGGQDNDLGTMVIAGKEYKVTYAEKVSKTILHFIDPPLQGTAASYIGQKIHGKIDAARRQQLRNHHTATHVIYQSARRVLGPHVWQHGAKKTIEEAHLDITHFAALTEAQEQAIEAEANRAVRAGYRVRKTWEPKEAAEQKHGYKLYQGGVAAGSVLRVVDIEGFDTEACCGTHCETTSQIGMIRLIRSHRISDGIARLHFVAGDRALQYTAEQSTLLNRMCDLWGVQASELFPTADRIFRDYKRFSVLAKRQALDILQLQLRTFIAEPENRLLLVASDEPDPTLYHSGFNQFIIDLKRTGKAVVAVGKTYIYGLFGNDKLFDIDSIEGVLEASRSFEGRSKRSKKQDTAAASTSSSTAPVAAAVTTVEPAAAAVAKAAKWMPLRRVTSIKVAVKGGKPQVVDGIIQLSGSVGAQQLVLQFFLEKGFKEFQN